MNKLPYSIEHVKAPPVKCQGIKTKLIPFIFGSLQWSMSARSRWIEPFLGSGVVALNLAPDAALLCDTNRHIIGLYQAIQSGEITGEIVREHLICEGRKLSEAGESYYYEVRTRFNKEGSPLDFLFLNRSCFNGVMRFNRQGKFNVPFGHKPQRFAQAYITKITNQINWAARQMRGKDWEFRVAPWQETLSEARPEDFVYLDPPYVGRHTDYYNSWSEQEAEQLAAVTQKLPCGFALSMWLENRYRKNIHLEQCWSDLEMRLFTHFYHVGSNEKLRNAMEEALVIKPGYVAPDVVAAAAQEPEAVEQLSLEL